MSVSFTQDSEPGWAFPQAPHQPTHFSALKPAEGWAEKKPQVTYSPGGISHSGYGPRERLLTSGDAFGCHKWGQGCYWYSGVGPRMLLNLQHRGQLPAPNQAWRVLTLWILGGLRSGFIHIPGTLGCLYLPPGKVGGLCPPPIPSVEKLDDLLTEV